MVKNVVENRLNGKIEVHNEEVSYKKVHRIGAVFKITVPIKKY